ncbi:MAG: VCBS domain-containing protein, partial [Actinomycetota bacterium]
MAVSTVSYTKTPQAGDDTYNVTEDWLSANCTSDKAIILDVLANDLGGNAKKLYSIDDGEGATALKDLLASDVGKGMVSEWESTAEGNQIRINCGKIEFKFAKGFDINSLNVGDTYSDSFTYAIQLGNGTISYATVHINVAGENDGPTVDGPLTAGGTEDGAVCTLDLLTGAKDVDKGAQLSVKGIGDLPAGVTLDGCTLKVDPCNAAFQHLAEGKTQEIVVKYQVTDEHGATVDQTATITITGTNDTPTVAAAVTGGGTEDGAAFQVDLLQGAADADDGAQLSVKGIGDLPAGVTLSGNTLTVDPGHSAFQHLAEGKTQEITVKYQVTDEHGATVDQTATITITGTNDIPTVAAAVTAGGTEDGTAFQVDLLQGAADVDDGAQLSVKGIGKLPAGVTLDGNTLTVDPSHSAFQHLAEGKTQEITVKYQVSDEHGATVAQTATITITGTNDVPTVAAAVAAGGAEDGAAFQVDLLQGAADADDGAQLSVKGIGDLPAGVTLSGNTLTVDPGHSAFQHLAEGKTQDLVVKYQITDEHGATVDQTATITITGTNDTPKVDATLTAAGTEDGTTVTLDLLSGASDADDGAQLSVKGIGDLPAGVTLDGNTLTVDPANAAFQHLAAGVTQDVVITYQVTDEHGAAVNQTATVTVTGVNDQATIGGTAIGSVKEDGTLTASGKLNVTDVDDGQAHAQAYTTTIDEGTFSVDANGNWLFSLNNDAVQYLSKDTSLTRTFSVLSADGTAKQDVTITIAGTDEPVTRASAPPVYTGADPNDFDTAGSGPLGSLVTYTSNQLNGDNTILGTSGADTIDAKNGTDVIYGYGGGDTLAGGQGIDKIYGGAGDDTLSGDSQSDTIYGGSGNDVIN